MTGEPSCMLVFVRPDLTSGPILYASGEFSAEANDISWDFGDHDPPTPDCPGLQVFEGWVEVGPDPDPDVTMVGEWRPLTHWELCRVRFGLPPWGKATQTADPSSRA